MKKKKYCSLQCARSAKENSTDSMVTSEVDAVNSTSTPVKQNDHSQMNGKSTPQPQTPQPPQTPVPEEEPAIMKWTVQDVCDFIKNLPGCSDYAEDFAIQEIDGQALLLLKENHLVNAMGMKLGPALKIVAKVDSMKMVPNPLENGQQPQSQ